MLLDKLQTLTGKNLSVIADGLTKPVGGNLAGVDGDFIIIKPSDGDAREILLPINRIVSILIMHTDGGKHGRDFRKESVR